MAYQTRNQQNSKKLNEGRDVKTEMDNNFQQFAPQEHNHTSVTNIEKECDEEESEKRESAENEFNNESAFDGLHKEPSIEKECDEEESEKRESAENEFNNESACNVLHKEPSVAKETPKKMENQNLIVGNIYIVEKDYNRSEDSELSVKKDDRVRLMNVLCDSWCKVKILNSNKEGLVPRNIISSVGNVVKDNNQLKDTEQSVKNVGRCQQKDTLLKGLLGFLRKIIKEHVGNNWIPVFVAVFVIVIACFYFIYCSEDSLTLKIDKLEGRYKNLPDDIWSTLMYCLNSTLNKNIPCIIVMLNRGDTNFSNLLNDIGDLSVELVKQSLNHKQTSKFVLKGSTVTESKDNYSFEYLKSKLIENRVMLIDEMEIVPPIIMESFHSLCDVYDPAVDQAVIVFLLNYKHIRVDLEENDSTIANNILFELWKDFIDRDLINPLAIRVTENVINLQHKS